MVERNTLDEKIKKNEKKSEENRPSILQGIAKLSSYIEDNKKTKDGNIKLNDFYEITALGKDEKTYKVFTVSIIAIAPHNEFGYQGFAFEDVDTGIIYVVHQGSKAINPENLSRQPDEVFKDWGIADVDILEGRITNQFYLAKEFLEDVKRKYPDKKIVQIGQSLGGFLSQLLGALEENKNIETITFNAFGAKEQKDVLEKSGFMLSSDNSNIKNYRYKNEMVSKIKNHVGKIYVSSKEEKDFPAFHNIKTHQNNKLSYREEKEFETLEGDFGHKKFKALVLTSKIALKPKSPQGYVMRELIKTALSHFSSDKQEKQNKEYKYNKEDRKHEKDNLLNFDNDKENVKVSTDLYNRADNPQKEETMKAFHVDPYEKYRKMGWKVIEEKTRSEISKDGVGFAYFNRGKVEIMTEDEIYERLFGRFIDEFKEAAKNRGYVYKRFWKKEE